jgi:hypothetical protein
MFRNIPSATLRELVKLSERKEALMAQIQNIDREMLRLESKHGNPSSDGKKAPLVLSNARQVKNRRPRSERGALKEKILRALRATGKRGATIGELSRKLDVPSNNLYVWFHTTGKNVSGLKKIGTAKYRLA